MARRSGRRNLGIVLVGVFLILYGLLPFINVPGLDLSIVTYLVAILAGIVLIIDYR